VPEEPAVIPLRIRRAIVAGALVTTIAGALGTAFLPVLLVKQPIVLLALSADARNLVLVAPRIDLPIVLAVAFPRRAAGMLATYGLAVLYGPAALGWAAKRLPRMASLLGRLERVYMRIRVPLLLLWPMYTTSALAGVTRVALRHFVPWMLAGQLAHALVVYYLGDALGDVTDRLVSWLAEHLVESTAVCASGVALQQLVAYYRRKRAAEQQPES
jgi:membrane protein DedA with SNARE-associated domain